MKTIPATVILDDSGPVNTMTCHHPEGGHVRDVPVAFLERFVEATRAVGLRGKFTLLPQPCGLGPLDQGIPGYPPAELERFLRIVREEIAPHWDITPEILTHGRALDLKSGRFLDLREDQWAETQDAEGLRAYFVHALTILKKIGIPANGITSPWMFGQGVEEAYAEAVGRSLREVFGLERAWYFLHFGEEMEDVRPRVMRRGERPGTGVVCVVGGTGDPIWAAQEHADPAAAREAVRPALERLLSADGRRGRIAELAASGQPVVLLTHWQALFCNGHGAGLEAFVELIGRINTHFGSRLEWTTPSTIARKALADGA